MTTSNIGCSSSSKSTPASLSLAVKDDANSIETFLNSVRVISIVNLLTKYKIKLWELDNIDDAESDRNNNNTKNHNKLDELLMKLSDESGIDEEEVKRILARLQTHSKSKLEDNRRFSASGIAKFKLKIIGNLNQKQEVNFEFKS